MKTETHTKLDPNSFVWIIGKPVGGDFQPMCQPFQGRSYPVAFTTLPKAQKALSRSRDAQRGDPAALPSEEYKPVKYRLIRLVDALQKMNLDVTVLILDSGTDHVKLLQIPTGLTVADVLGEDGEEGEHAN